MSSIMPAFRGLLCIPTKVIELQSAGSRPLKAALQFLFTDQNSFSLPLFHRTVDRVIRKAFLARNARSSDALPGPVPPDRSFLSQQSEDLGRLVNFHIPRISFPPDHR